MTSSSYCTFEIRHQSHIEIPEKKYTYVALKDVRMSSYQIQIANQLPFLKTADHAHFSSKKKKKKRKEKETLTFIS